MMTFRAVLLKTWEKNSFSFSISRYYSNSIRIVLISDTHSKHEDLGHLPAGDILLHAGDFTESRFPPKPQEYKDFIDWFSAQPHKQKVFISGNRDIFMDTKTCTKFEPSSGFWMRQMQDYAKGAKSLIYLEDSTCSLTTECDSNLSTVSSDSNLSSDSSVSVYGSPWTAIYGKPGKAFQIPPAHLLEKWERIPKNLDILITHMPPYSIQDSNSGKTKSGCRELARLVLDTVRPRLHVFGHIHESHGHKVIGPTLFVNAASKRPRSTTLNTPLVIDLPRDRRKPARVIS